MSADRIDIVRFRAMATIDMVWRALERDEQNGRPAALYLATESKFWTHDPAFLRWQVALKPGAPLEAFGPRGEAITIIKDWRGVLETAQREAKGFGAHGIATFMAAHALNCRHPIDDRAWSAIEWRSYDHALRRANHAKEAA